MVNGFYQLLELKVRHNPKKTIVLYESFCHTIRLIVSNFAENRTNFSLSQRFDGYFIDNRSRNMKKLKEIMLLLFVQVIILMWTVNGLREFRSYSQRDR